MAETFKNWLTEQLKDPEFAEEYSKVSAQMDSELAAVQIARSTLARELIEVVDGFDDWVWCTCSECKVDGRSHAINTTTSLASLSSALRARCKELGVELVVATDSDTKGR